MKLTGEVIAVETTGDRLKISLQMQAKREADWRPMGVCIISVPAVHPHGMTYHVGRVVEIEMEPKYK